MSAAGYDVEVLRAQFPALQTGIARFDGPGGTQTPTVVGEAIAHALTAPLSNRGDLVDSERNAEQIVHAFRRAAADYLGARPEGIVHGRSATQLIFDFSRHLPKTWRREDEIILSRLDHDANVRPWVLAADKAGVRVRWVDVDPNTAELRIDEYERLLGPRTRLVAVTAGSNLLGTRPDVPRIAALARAAGAVVVVDAVHAAAHVSVDLPALGANAVVCSPYKFLGPHAGVLAGEPEWLETLAPDKLAPATDQSPERFEFGTLPYETLAGVTRAIDFIADIAGGEGDRSARLSASRAAIEHHESRLRDRIEAGVRAFGDRVIVRSRASTRTPTLALELPGDDTREVAEFLAERGVHAPAGTFYAMEPAKALGLWEQGVVRVGIAPYTNDDDVDRLLEGLTEYFG